MKHLSAMHIVGETGADEFSPTHFSNALTIPTYRDGDQLLVCKRHPTFAACHADPLQL